ncbi:MAG: hypothetical protein J3K34DRAFT_423229 [Monoraphidium minutum]|nr:MAG: hypothetical protein J3K34DRAFT_423229 [Monoraphidium minutum]
MPSHRALIWAAIALALADVDTAHAARGLRESLVSKAAKGMRGLLASGGGAVLPVPRALLQVVDTWSRSRPGTYIDDGSRTGYSQYAAVSGYAEAGNPYGYYGSSAAAGAFGADYNRAGVAISRAAYPSGSYLGNRARIRDARYGSSTPWDMY